MNPVVVFDVAGSDTGASGAGPATPVTGNNAILAASTVVDLSADAPNLAGVAVDGSAVLWVQSASGQQFAAITAIDDVAKTVTVSVAFTVNASGLTWAIGGQRATFDNADSRRLFADAKAGWVIEYRSPQTITGSLLDLTARGDTSNPIVMRSVPEHTLISKANNFGHGMRVEDNWQFEGLHVSCSNTNNNAAWFGLRGDVRFDRLICDDAAGSFYRAMQRSSGGPTVTVTDSKFANMASFAISCSSMDVTAIGCEFVNCEYAVLLHRDSTLLKDCVIHGCTARGLYRTVATSLSAILMNCVIHGNAGDGIEITTEAATANLNIINCSITGNAGHGISFPASGSSVTTFVAGNNYGSGDTANALGPVSNLPIGDGLEVDPGYADAGNGDFTGGPELAGVGYPVTPLGAGQSATTPANDIGIAQGGGGGGGGFSLSRLVN